MSENNSLWIVSNFPPPTHGVSVFNKNLIEELNSRKIAYRFFRVGEKKKINTIELLSLRKAFGDFLLLLNCFQLALKSFITGKKITLYFTPSQYGYSVYRDLILMILMRPFVFKIVGHIHGTRWLHEWKGKKPWSRALYLGLKRCDLVVCLGNSYAAEMRRQTGFSCIGINNGLPAEQGKFSQVRTLDLKRGVRLLFLSNLMRSKGLWTSALSVREMNKQEIPVVLNCAGNWVFPEEEKKFIEEFKSEIDANQIRLMGYANQERKSELMHDSHFLVLPIENRHEGQPLSLLEAMRAGLIPITTSFGGIHDLFNFETGEMICNARFVKAEEIVELIKMFIRLPHLYQELSFRCVKHFEENLTFNRCVEELFAQIKKLEQSQKFKPVPLYRNS